MRVQVQKPIYIQTFEKHITAAHETARKNLCISSEAMKRQYDVNVTHHVYQSGDFVWLYQPTRKVGLCPKLQRSWDGPFRVVDRLSDLVYRIQRVGKT